VLCSNLLDPVTLLPLSSSSPSSSSSSLVLALYELEIPSDAAARAEAAARPIEDEALQALVLKDAAALISHTPAAVAAAQPNGGDNDGAGAVLKQHGDDPASLLVVPAAATPAPPRRASSPTSSQLERDRAIAAAGGAAGGVRMLHFRIYSAPQPTTTGATTTAPGPAQPARRVGVAGVELLGCCSVPASDLLRAAEGGLSGAGGTLELSLSHSTSPLASQTLRRAGTTLILHARPLAPEEQESEAGQQRTFERLLQLAASELPKRVHAQEGHARALVPCSLRVDNLPPDALPLQEEDDDGLSGAASPSSPSPSSFLGPDADSVWLAALFERDLRTGLMTLQGVTPWTRADLTLHAGGDGGDGAGSACVRFGGAIRLDYFSGQGQVFQVSLYRFRGAQLRQAFELSASLALQAGAAPTAVPAALRALLREEERVGSTPELQLDWLGLESQLERQVRKQRQQQQQQGQKPTTEETHHMPNSAAASAAARAALDALGGRLYHAPGRRAERQLYLSLPLTHDLDPRQQRKLEQAATTLTIGVDVAATALLLACQDENNDQPSSLQQQVLQQDRPRNVAKERKRASMRPLRDAAVAVPNETDPTTTIVPAGAAPVPAAAAAEAALPPAVPAPAPAAAAASSSSSSAPSYVFPLPAGAAPEATDVVLPSAAAGSGAANDDDALMTPHLLAMMRQGQDFLVFADTNDGVDAAGLAPEPRVMRLFHRPDAFDPSLPGHLYLCDPSLDPLSVSFESDLATGSGGFNTAPIDLLHITDVYLGPSAPAFHTPAAFRTLAQLDPTSRSIDAEGDDGVSFSLVAAPAAAVPAASEGDGERPILSPTGASPSHRSLHALARSPARRSAWVLAIMRVIGSGEEEEQEVTVPEPETEPTEAETTEVKVADEEQQQQQQQQRQVAEASEGNSDTNAAANHAAVLAAGDVQPQPPSAAATATADVARSAAHTHDTANDRKNNDDKDEEEEDDEDEADDFDLGFDAPLP
jgi:hypothetical protein